MLVIYRYNYNNYIYIYIGVFYVYKNPIHAYPILCPSISRSMPSNLDESTPLSPSIACAASGATDQPSRGSVANKEVPLWYIG